MEDHDDAALDQMWNANVKAPLSMTRLALPHLRKSGSGRIINVASIAGKAVYNNNAGHAGSNRLDRESRAAHVFERRTGPPFAAYPAPQSHPMRLSPCLHPWRSCIRANKDKHHRRTPPCCLRRTEQYRGLRVLNKHPPARAQVT